MIISIYCLSDLYLKRKMWKFSWYIYLILYLKLTDLPAYLWYLVFLVILEVESYCQI